MVNHFLFRAARSLRFSRDIGTLDRPCIISEWEIEYSEPNWPLGSRRTGTLFRRPHRGTICNETSVSRVWKTHERGRNIRGDGTRCILPVTANTFFGVPRSEEDVRVPRRAKQRQ